MNSKLRTALLPLSWIYRAAVAARNRRYDRGQFEIGRLPAPVVSVGNLTVGGSGKTPVVSEIARELIGRGLRVAVLSRGYGRRSDSPYVLVSDGNVVSAAVEESGDEPFELAEEVPGLLVAVGADRLACGLRLHRTLAPNVFLLDDGFQHRRLHRDLDLVCIDAGEAESSLRLLPAGRLREPFASLGRAHAVVWTRWSDDRPREELRRRVPAEVPQIRVRSRTSRLIRVGASGETVEVEAFRDEPVGVLLAVAAPHRILESLPTRVVYSVSRADHHFWSELEVASISSEARRRGAKALLTTRKDAVKMGFLSGSGASDLPVYALGHEVEVLDRETLRKLLDRLEIR